MSEWLRRFWDDESAQEVAEYAFLSLFIGLVGLLLWPVIVELMGDRYADYNEDVQGEWEPPDLP